MTEKIKNKSVVYGWLMKADDDFSLAKNLFEESEYYDHVCFLSQQAVEKYLKVLVIISKGKLKKEERTHNLIYLSQLGGLDFSAFESDLRKLSNAYVPARYPGDGYVKFNKEEAKECLRAAERIIDFIKSENNLAVYCDQF
ncbi:MAG: hypothetical protein A3F95_01450 [Candidatus Nealsonbacteria bacterium RIFCSPLOWO2_12_FULL_39_31]|uniref:HEPN domain-containing protein n=2 Tax=Candidatus Nealsoniibacteriota TaxID=1817911 RepID=A0A1G2EQJ9_9BACT|nr:MAG: HEPN domain protein [Parcubacteria group bacterium GW2011_GWA2_38_27]KKQ96138.1 MAG: HEPN domain protein [Parcubacteria group bacterium GW2011_GWC2_39_11]OGZ19879.1 MAG: hypothetical protein A2626_03140 [Candidatus Nealsonbacteria bacterium RIFCSPHIGHO2_01_FULL_38_55]OGZ21946.1 MAG: hypothetical protein A3C48_01785 [Candidatus Nealsonbacteria bacterium RIFCSPHIGHO2_02_FULL_38_75]OGZ23102.1 MAG: hypothetical protein A3E18_02670 [Candidatus Nealsonbacteria bacterium RIFCSPHIGHO2_12_FULL_3